MPPQRDRKGSITAEEKLLRRTHARRRFKAIVYLVMCHRFWLEEDDDDSQLTDNVRKNVQLLTRKKDKKSLLTIKEKSILLKPAEDRTEIEKAHLNRVIGGLKCFRRYPAVTNKNTARKARPSHERRAFPCKGIAIGSYFFLQEVKSQLAAVTYFKYFEPGRVVIKQNDPPYSLYFILTGEVLVSQIVWDPVLNENVTLNLGTMVAGNMFGEVSLLHGIYRTATITTLTPCEFLLLTKNDFDRVLKQSVEENWKKIQKAMHRFNYFDNWDEIATRECCILARINEYGQDETILGDGIGLPNYAYFILKGRCQVIEHLLVKVHEKNGRKSYKLYEGKCEEEPQEEKVECDVVAIKNQSTIGFGSTHRSSIKSSTPLKIDTSSETDTPPKMGTPPKDDNSRDVPPKAAVQSKIQIAKRASIVTKTSDDSTNGKTDSRKSQMSSKVSRASTRMSRASALTATKSQMSRISRFLPVPRKKPLIGETVEPIELPENVEVHFMQCCFLNELAMFGIGENFENRRIVAVTPIECLLIPRYWLWQRNKDYVWSKVQQYLNNHIPSTQDLFKYFVQEKKWKTHRKRLVEDILKKKNIVNFNSIHNVPYSIRITEDTDFP